MSEQLVDSNNLFQDIATKKFSAENSIYAFTTENISKAFSPKIGDNVLTIAGSGDQGLNSILFGAKQIDFFDVNKLSIYWVQLKIAAIRLLSFEEFLKFFLRPKDTTAESLKFETFNRIKLSIPPEAGEFFEKCYKACGFNGAILRESSLFRLSFDQNNYTIVRNLYLESKYNYDRLKSLMQNVTFRFHHSSGKEIAKNSPTAKYSFIYLSNLADYVDFWYQNHPDPLRSFVDEVIVSLAKTLSDNGELWAAYLYDHRSLKLHSKLYDPVIRRRYFSIESLTYEERYFPGVIPGTEDASIILPRARNDL